MAIYAISFRIGDTGDHQERYKSLVAKIKEEAGQWFWDETTSLFIIHSVKDTATLASNIYVGCAIDTLKDKLLVINLSEKSHKTYCHIQDPAKLEALMGLR